jgi:hypothetical protein
MSAIPAYDRRLALGTGLPTPIVQVVAANAGIDIRVAARSAKSRHLCPRGLSTFTVVDDIITPSTWSSPRTA